MIKFIDGNHVTLLNNGVAYFPALAAAIHEAKHEIFLQTYIYEPDDTGTMIGQALMDAASRGVAVFLMLDGFGSHNLPDAYVNKLTDSGVEVLFFRPKISPWTLKSTRLRRLHSKVVVIDRKVGFVGGINIVDDYNTPSHTPPRIDYAVKIEGPVVDVMHKSVALAWKKVCQSQHRSVNRATEWHGQLKNTGDMAATFLERDNFKHRRTIEDAYLALIESAIDEVFITNAYFLPSLRFRRALIEAAVRGVKVSLFLQERTEFWPLDMATRALYGSLLSRGVRIYEYQKSFMHSKVAVIDERYATVGSSNIDPFSLFLSHEANVFVDHAGFASTLKQSIQYSIRHGAKAINIEEWSHRSYFKRFAAWSVYGSLQLLMGFLGIPEE